MAKEEKQEQIDLIPEERLKATLNDAIRDEKERMKKGKQNNPY